MSAAVVTYASDVLMQIDLSVAVLGFVYGSAWSDEWPYFQPEGGVTELYYHAEPNRP